MMVMVMPMMMMAMMVMDDECTLLHFRGENFFARPCLNRMKLQRIPQISKACKVEFFGREKRGVSPSRNIAIKQTPASKCTFAGQVSKWGFDVPLEMDMFIVVL